MKTKMFLTAMMIMLLFALGACKKQSATSPSPIDTPVLTITHTQEPSSTGTPVDTATNTPTLIETATFTETATMQNTSTETPTNTNTATVTETYTETATVTKTSTCTSTATATVSCTATMTSTVTQTVTPVTQTMLFEYLIYPNAAYTGVKDAIISNIGGGANNYGKCTYLYAGSTASGTNKYRSLLYFDLSALPAGATIVSAKLTLTVFSAGTDADTNTLNTYAVSTSWPEGSASSCSGAVTNDGATWLKYDGVTSWTTAGGDYTPIPIATPVNKNFSDYSVVQINFDPSVIQGWFNAPATNYGMLIKFSNESTGAANIVGFLSSNQTSLGEKPTLTVKYLP